MTAKYFRIPWATAGDVTAIPDAVQPTGEVSYTQGYGANYAEELGVSPTAKALERDKFNQLAQDITTALQQYQQHGTPDFITSADNGGSAFSYSQYDRVLYSGNVYESLVSSNTDTPPSSKWLLLDSNQRRIRLTANTTFYVATTGSDTTGTGASGAPWATIQKAIDYIAASIDLNRFNATIQVADGTYAAAYSKSDFVGGGDVQLQGNITTPANCLISTSTANDCLIASQKARLFVGGFKVTNTKTNGNGISANMGGMIIINGKMDFGVCSGSHVVAIDSGSGVGLYASYNITGGAYSHLAAHYCGQIINSGAITVTLTGTPAFVSAFASSNLCSSIQMQYVTFSGTATGQRYVAVVNGAINTGGGGANYFPGSIAGTTANGGVYV